MCPVSGQSREPLGFNVLLKVVRVSSSLYNVTKKRAQKRAFHGIETKRPLLARWWPQADEIFRADGQVNKFLETVVARRPWRPWRPWQRVKVDQSAVALHGCSIATSTAWAGCLVLSSLSLSPLNAQTSKLCTRVQKRAKPHETCLAVFRVVGTRRARQRIFKNWV